MKLKQYPKVSIIIPLYVKTLYFYETVEKCLQLDYPNYEILIGTDKNETFFFKDKKIRILRTGAKNTGPAEKRDIGILKASGSIIAFLDDDSYPETNWLKKAVEILEKKNVEGVCGPGLTPQGDNYWQKVTGAVLGSSMGSGPYYYRFEKGEPRFVDDYPAYNMLIKKDILKKVGGFGTKFYGGEDTAVCIKILEAGGRIYYHPEIIVYHHRRSFPFEYAKQVGNVGLHRGFFVKAYPKTSLRLSYFLPSISTLIFFGILIFSVLNHEFLKVMLPFALLTYVTIYIEGFKKNKWDINLMLPFAVVINHLSYGLNFLKGLVYTKTLTR